MKHALASGMNGQYHEINDNGRIRFFEIHFCEFSKEKVERLEKMGSLDESVLGSYIVLIKEPIPDSTSFLYKLQTYNGVAGIDDLWEFNKNISKYEQYGFADIESLLVFCKEKWGVKKEDFKSIQDTNIPH